MVSREHLGRDRTASLIINGVSFAEILIRGLLPYGRAPITGIPTPPRESAVAHDLEHLLMGVERHRTHVQSRK